MMTKSVLHLISSGGYYGAEKVVIELASYLKIKGWDVHVGVLKSIGADAIINIAHANNLKTYLFSGRNMEILKVLHELNNYIEEHDIDIIHSHGYKSDFISLCVNASLDVRRIATCHNWLSDSFKLKIYEWVDKKVLCHFDFVVVVSPKLLDVVRCMGILPTHSKMIANGISLESLPDMKKVEALRVELGVAAKEPIIVRIGRLSYEKGNDVLLKAMSSVIPYVNAHLVFIGEGEQADSLKALVERYQLGKWVIFAGYRWDVTDLLHGSDICCISSLDEGLPIVLLEAMAARVPVVTTSVGAIPSVIRNGENGWLVPPGDSKTLANAILEALVDRKKAKTLADQAYYDYKMLYSQEAMGEKYIEIYDKFISGPLNS